MSDLGHNHSSGDANGAASDGTGKRLPPPPSDPHRWTTPTPVPSPPVVDLRADDQQSEASPGEIVPVGSRRSNGAPTDEANDKKSHLGQLIAGLKAGGVPAEVRDELSAIWIALSADVKREAKGMKMRDMRNPNRIMRTLGGMTQGLTEGQAQMIDLAVRHPLPIADARAQLASAAAISGGATAAEQAVTYGSAGSAIGVAIVGAAMAELLDTYVIASARVLQLQKAGIQPSQHMVQHDLHRALGGSTRQDRHSADGDQSARVVSWMASRLARKVTTRVMKGIALAVGVGWASASTMRDLRKVQELAVPDHGLIDLPPDSITEL